MPRDLRLRPWVPAIVLGVGCFGLLGARQQEDVVLLRPLEQVLPIELLDRTATDLVLSQEEVRIAGVSSYVMRLFESENGVPLSVYVGYYESQTRGKTIHSPKNCLPGAGWEPLSAGEVTVAVGSGSVTVNRYLIGREGAMAVVYYWYQGRGRVAADEYAVKWHLIRDRALGGRSEEALVRVLVPVTPDFPVSQADSFAAATAGLVIPAVFSAIPDFPGRDPLAAHRSGLEPDRPGG